MEKITSIKELRESILQLEIKQVDDERLLREQLVFTYESMKPVNVVKNSIKDLLASPDLKDDVFGASLGLAAGYLSKKAAVGSTHNPLKQLLGAFIQLGVTNVVAKNSDGIKSLLIGLISKYLSGSKVNVDHEK